MLTVEVTADSKASQVKAKNVILCTGSEARMLPGLEPGDRILSNIEILSLKEIPKSLVIVGAGAVGVEFASIFRSFGAEVTIIEMLPRLVPVEDEEISKELARVYRKRGIDFHTGAKVDKIEKSKSGVTVNFSVDGKPQKMEAERILIAVGRKPRTENIGLERTKIKPDRGFIKTDSWMQTAEPGRLRHRRHRAGDAATGARRRHGRNRRGNQNCRQKGQAHQSGAHSQRNLLPS